MRRFRIGKTHIKCLIAPVIDLWIFFRILSTQQCICSKVHILYMQLLVALLSKSRVVDASCAVKLCKLWMVRICLYVWICYVCWYTIPECSLHWVAQPLFCACCVFVALFSVCVFFFPFSLAFFSPLFFFLFCFVWVFF